VIVLSPAEEKLYGKWLPIQDVAAFKAKYERRKR
jgi:hypothetical protein